MDDSIYRLRATDVLALCVCGLLALGSIMVCSAATSVTGDAAWTLGKTESRHLIYVATAVTVFFGIGHLDYRRLYHRFLRKGEPAPFADTSYRLLRPSLPKFWKMLTHPVGMLYLAGLAVCLVVLIPGIGREVNGARRWLVFGPVQLQASEAGKWACVIVYAWLLAARPLDLSRFRNLILACIPLGVIALLVVKEDFGTAALISLCCLALLMVGGTRLWHFGILLPPLMAIGFWFIHHKDYRWRRVTAFINPFERPEHEGYHLIQSLLSFTSGGIAGRGLGNGLQKLGYLPEDTTDFIFSIICEELGLFGALLTIALYLGILWAAWQIIRSCSDRFGRLLGFGVAAMVGLQAAINIAVATVSVPPKGLPLPLVSFGGSGLIITSAALGLLYSIGRTWDRPAEALPLHEPSYTSA